MNLPHSRQLTLCMLFLISPLSAQAAKASDHCNASDHKWVPAKYYVRESVVFYENQWYQARQTHEGREPGRGEFAWQALQGTPTCAANTDVVESGTAPTAKMASKASEPKTHQTDCPQPTDWSFAAVYSIGDYARHEDQTYRAIRPTSGTLPGTGHPPHWQPAESPCR